MLNRGLAEQLRTAIMAEPDAVGRARLLLELVREVYDVVKMRFHDGGLVDSSERSGIGEVSDAVMDYCTSITSAAMAFGPSTDQVVAADAGAASPAQAQVHSGDDDFDRWANDPAEAFQASVSVPLQGDELNVELRVIEAQKCGAILHSALGGQDLYLDGARLVGRLLEQRALAAIGQVQAMRDPWPELDALPWPPPPGLRKQYRQGTD